MSSRIAMFCWSALTALTLVLVPVASTVAGGENGVVRVKSAYAIDETVSRLKRDIAAKGIKLFKKIDQSKLASDAGIKVRPLRCWSSAIRRSGPIHYLQSGRWPRLAGCLLVFEDEKGVVWTAHRDFAWIDRGHGITDREAQMLRTLAPKTESE